MFGISPEHISLSFVLFWCGFWTFLFVFLLYVWKDTDSTPHKTLLLHRTISCFATCFLSLFSLYLLHRSIFINNDSVPNSFLIFSGLYPFGMLKSSLVAAVLIFTLFFGPFVQSFFNVCDWYGNKTPWYKCVLYTLKDIFVSEDYLRTVIIAPIVEELVFRSAMIPLLIVAHYPRFIVCTLPPLFFGLAHLHHFPERAREHGVPKAVLACVFQMLFTTVFGAMSAFFYIRTGSIASSIVAHSICNGFGFPDFQEAFTHHKKKIIVPAYCIGLVSFFVIAPSLTSPSLFPQTTMWK